MKPAPFDYYRPDTVEEAIAALGESDAPKVLAGGQSLIPTLNFRLSAPTLLVDIRRIEGLAVLSVDDDAVTIGAAVTQATVERSSLVSSVVPGLAAALAHVGHLQIRNSGTVCGSLAHADPAAELPALAVALGAEVTVAGPGGERTVPASEFFLGPFWTALEGDEIVTSVRFPAAKAGDVAVVEEISRRSGDFAVAGVAGSISVSEGAITGASLSSFGVSGSPSRLANAEAALVGFTGDDGSAVAGAAQEDAGDPLEDLHASGQYRRDVLGALVLRAARSALGGGAS